MILVANPRLEVIGRKVGVEINDVLCHASITVFGVIIFCTAVVHYYLAHDTACISIVALTPCTCIIIILCRSFVIPFVPREDREIGTMAQQTYPATRAGIAASFSVKNPPFPLNRLLKKWVYPVPFHSFECCFTYHTIE